MPFINREGSTRIIETVRNWKHYLMGRHFSIKTDQRSFAYIFDRKQRGKIKNVKIMRCRIELSCYNFDIVHQPGKENIHPDTLSRGNCDTMNSGSLSELHQALCHPCVTLIFHFVMSQNLPSSMEDVKRMIRSCHICAEFKPWFHKPDPAHLIKATQQFEQLNFDFKGPLVGYNNNRYLLNVIEEYSRFTFLFSCSNMTTATVIKYFRGHFFLFGMPAYIHSNWGAAFMRRELSNFLHQKEIATSLTPTSYNPQGSGQSERYNGTVLEPLFSPSRPREYRHCTGKRFSLMHYTLFDHCSVLLQT